VGQFDKDRLHRREHDRLAHVLTGGSTASFTVSGQPGDHRRRPGRDGPADAATEAVTPVILASPTMPAQEPGAVAEMSAGARPPLAVSFGRSHVSLVRILRLTTQSEPAILSHVTHLGERPNSE
jgi:hypothetical protein